MPSPKKDRQSVDPSMIIKDRLYTIRHDLLKPEHFENITAIFNLSDKKDLVLNPEKYIYTYWMTDKNVDEDIFFAIIRYCSALMKCDNQRVLLIGYQDAVDTMAACVVREYTGCDAKIALEVTRASRPFCLTKSELIETVFNYKIS